MRLVDKESGEMELENNMDTANTAKTLKEMHERNEISGRPAGTSFHDLSIGHCRSGGPKVRHKADSRQL